MISVPSNNVLGYESQPIFSNLLTEMMQFKEEVKQNIDSQNNSKEEYLREHI